MQTVTPFADKLSGMDILIHAAAYYGEYYRAGGEKLLHDINVNGTIALLEAAYEKGIRNVVYISSVAILETSVGRATDESAPYDSDPGDPYFQSKIDAEKAIFRFMESHPDMRIVILLPTVMLGAGDRGPTPTGKLVLNIIKGEMKFILPGSNNIVDARDVALAVVTGMEKGTSGERYILGGRKYEYTEFYKVLGEITGKPVPARKAPPAMLMIMSHIMGLISKFTGKPPILKPGILKRLLKDFWFDSGKAERELGIHFRPLSETLADTVKWFQSEEYV